MTSPPGTPIVTPAQLGTYLGRTDIDPARATMLIRYAQDLAESILFPLPVTAAGVVMRVAARGISNVSQAQSMGLGSALISYGTGPYGVGGMYLSKLDKSDLRRIGGLVGGVFTIDVMPTTAGESLPWWDTGNPYGYGIDDSFDVIP